MAAARPTPTSSRWDGGNAGAAQASGEGGHRLEVGHVDRLQEEARSVGGGDPLVEAGALGLDGVRHGDDGAVGQETQRHGLAERAGAASDDRHPPVEGPGHSGDPCMIDDRWISS